MRSYKFKIADKGDPSVGLFGCHDTITITLESGDPGGDEGEFEEYVTQALRDWYDTNKVRLMTVKG